MITGILIEIANALIRAVAFVLQGLEDVVPTAFITEITAAWQYAITQLGYFNGLLPINTILTAFITFTQIVVLIYLVKILIWLYKIIPWFGKNAQGLPKARPGLSKDISTTAR